MVFDWFAKRVEWKGPEAVKMDLFTKASSQGVHEEPSGWTLDVDVVGQPVPSDGVEQAQRREGGAYVHSVQQNETKGPLHTLLSPLGHKGWDPQHTAAEALKPLQEALPPLLTDEVLEGPLHH